MIVIGYHWFTEYFYYITATSGPSMLPTIPHANGPWYLHPVVLISRYYKHGRDVKVGDIVVYSSPQVNSSMTVKRIIGMPGDLVCVVTPGKLGGGR